MRGQSINERNENRRKEMKWSAIGFNSRMKIPKRERNYERMRGNDKKIPKKVNAGI